MKPKDWFVIEKDGEFYAVEDIHDGVEPKMIGGKVVGICSFRKPVDAIDHIKFVYTRR